MASTDLKKFAEQMKRSALGVKFGKKLFTNPTSINPKDITTIIKTLGLEVPPDLLVTAEIAQLLIVGGTAIDSYNNAKTAQEVTQATNQTAATTRLAASFAEKQGYIDRDVSMTVRLGATAAQLYSSAGSDVSAWVTLAADLMQINASKGMEADQRAIQDLNRKYQEQVLPQQAAATNLMKRFLNEEIGIFGFLAGVAYESPMAWPQYIGQNSKLKEIFPELNFVPIVDQRIEGYGSVEIWGSWPWPLSGRYVIQRWESVKEIKTKTLGVDANTKEKAAEFIFNTLLKPWIVSYEIANYDLLINGNASIQACALLSMLTMSNAYLSNDFDYVSAMIGANITPLDLGERNILYKISDEYVQKQLSFVDQTFRSTGISTGYENKGIRLVSNARNEVQKEVKRIQQSYDIRQFVKFEPFKQSLNEYFQFEPVSFEKDPSFKGQITQKFSNKQVTAWRDLNNFISVLDLLQQFRLDPYLKDTQFARSVASYLPNVDDFDESLRNLSSLSLMRNSNLLAKGEISFYTDIPLEKLTKLNETGPAVYGEK